MAVVAVESSVNETVLCYKVRRNKAKGSIQSRIDRIASSVCQTADNCDNCAFA